MRFGVTVLLALFLAACGSSGGGGDSGGNAPPVARDVAYHIDRGEILEIEAPGVLANDEDPDGDPVTAILLTGPANGTLTLSPDGSFRYEPAADFHDTDAFSYAATDGELVSAPATVTVTVYPVDVQPVDRPPVLAPIGNKSVAEGHLLGFAVSAADPDGDSVTILAAPLPAGAAFDGAAFTWTPTFAQAGDYQVTFTATAGGLTDSETITITVTDVDRPPVLAPIGNKTVAEGQLLSFTVSAADPDGDPVTITTSALPTGATFDGAIFRWTPTHDQAGSYPVTFTASARELQDSETVIITVHNVDRPPVLAPVGNKSVNEGAILSFTVSASDPDGDPVTIAADPLPAGATFDGTTFAWMPGSGQAGSYPVAFTASANGLKDTETITITVHHYFSDDFSDGDFDGWTVVDDAGRASTWRVSSGRLVQSVARAGEHLGSFLRGSFAVYDGGFDLSDYQVSVRVFPPTLTPRALSIQAVGLMFRYADPNNYYRLSLSRSRGYGRLEKRVNGVFSTLAVDGRGFASGQPLDLRVELAGSTILVYVDGEPRFAAEDSDLSAGTVALFTGGEAAFDDVVVEGPSLEPKVVLSSPAAFSVAVTDSAEFPYTLQVSASAVNVPPGGGVLFRLDNEREAVDYSKPYAHTFWNVPAGDRLLETWLVDGGGLALPGALAADVNPATGVGGAFLVAFGSSSPCGTGDDEPGDNDSADGRNLSWGYTPILNDLLSASLGRPVTVVNEGLGGTTAAEGVARLASSLATHPDSQFWLIQFGGNEANAGVSAEAYRASLQQLITGLRNAGKIPVLSKVQMRMGACSTCDWFEDPSTEPVNLLLEEYNLIIDQLVVENDLPVVPPDFYTYFSTRPELYFDPLHPNGVGYVSMANLWWEAIEASGLLGE